MDQDKILEQRIKDIAEQVYAEKTLKSKYGVAQVPFHVHSGTDSSRVNEKDLVSNIKNQFVFSIVGDGNPHVLVFNNIPNVRQLILTGGAISATRFAIINGSAVFGKIYGFNYSSGETFDPTSTVAGESLGSVSNAFSVAPLVPDADVSVAPGFIARSPGAEVEMEIVLVTEKFITVGYTIDAGWTFAATVQLI